MRLEIIRVLKKYTDRLEHYNEPTRSVVSDLFKELVYQIILKGGEDNE